MTIINQPHDGALEDLLFDFLDTNPSIEFIFISVAYAKLSGVNRLYGRLRTLLDNNCNIIITVGIDQRNTSFEALMALSEVTSNLYIYHDRNTGVTFHPKVYLLQSSHNNIVITGSNNLTAGGLYINDEIFSYYVNDPSISSSVQNIIDRYTDTSSVFCSEATPYFINELLDQGLILTEHEIASSLPSGNRISRNTNNQNPFGRSNPSHRSNEEGVDVITNDIVSETHNGNQLGLFDYDSTIETTEEVVIEDSELLSFWKALSANDVSRSSSPGQIIIPIRFLHHFPFRNYGITYAGGQQAEIIFNTTVHFIDASGSIIRTVNIDGARVIHYIPAPDHPRQNSEIRFTFRNNIYQSLNAGDILVFSHHTSNSEDFTIYAISPGSTLYNDIRPSSRSNFGEIANLNLG